MTDPAKPEIVEVRLVRLDFTAHYEARDAGGDPAGVPIVYNDSEGKPIVVYGKAIADLFAALQAQCPLILERLKSPKA